MRLINDFQWRGLSVHFTGPGRGSHRIDPDVADALLAGIRACLENVVRHSGASTAEMEVVYTDDDGDGHGHRPGSGLRPDRRARRPAGTAHVGRRAHRSGRRPRGGLERTGEGTSVVMTAPARLLQVEPVAHDATADEVIE